MAVIKVADWQYKGMNLSITHVKNVPQEELDTWITPDNAHLYENLILGHHCGYVTCDIALSKEAREAIDVHGGITWYEINNDGTHTYGFDCGHYAGDGKMDSIKDWTVDRVRQECEALADQLFSFVITG